MTYQHDMHVTMTSNNITCRGQWPYCHDGATQRACDNGNKQYWIEQHNKIILAWHANKEDCINQKIWRKEKKSPGEGARKGTRRVSPSDSSMSSSSGSSSDLDSWISFDSRGNRSLHVLDWALHRVEVVFWNIRLDRRPSFLDCLDLGWGPWSFNDLSNRVKARI